jgi:L-lysine 6-transaminase
LKKSRGAYLHDSRTKKNFLDMFSFFASWPVSHNHPKLHEPNYLKTVRKTSRSFPLLFNSLIFVRN